MNLYREESSTPKYNAQRNLIGRTHYVDDGTLKFHKARVLWAHGTDDGLLFAMVESVALDMHGTRRGFRPVVFDLFGTVISRVDLEDAYKTRRAAAKEMCRILDGIDAKKHTIEAARASRDAYAEKMTDLIKRVRGMEK